MIHYTCDGCHRPLNPERDLRYVVKMEVYASLDPTDMELDEDRDHLEVPRWKYIQLHCGRRGRMAFLGMDRWDDSICAHGLYPQDQQIATRIVY